MSEILNVNAPALGKPLLSPFIKEVLDNTCSDKCDYHGCGGSDSWPGITMSLSR